MSREKEDYGPLPFTAHGSFDQANLPRIQADVKVLEQTGRAMLIAPQSLVAQDHVNGFTRFAGEVGKDPRQIEAQFLQHCLIASSLGGASIFFVNERTRYIGKSATFEAGFLSNHGANVIYTAEPEDVSFYVNPHQVRNVASLRSELLETGGLAGYTPSTEHIEQTWERMPLNVAAVAVGGLMTYRSNLLLICDNRWFNEAQEPLLTVPGTTVRHYESRDSALRRLFKEKLGITPTAFSKFKRPSFMVEDGSRYDKGGYRPRILAFDDRHSELASPTLHPQPGIGYVWASPSDAIGLIGEKKVETNAAELIEAYLSAA